MKRPSSSESLKSIIENARAQSKPTGQTTNTVLSFSSDSGKRRDVNASTNSDDKLRNGGSGAPTLRPIDPCVECDPPDPTPTPTVVPTPTPTATPTPSPTPTVTPTPTPTPGGDADTDGLDDTFENSLADGFTPFYHVSAGENSGTGFATFNNSVPQTVNQTFGPTPPISHFRVTPLGYGSINGVQYGFIQIDYLMLWNRDDGLVCSSICYVLAPDLGISLDEVESHNLDNERAAALVAAPIINGSYDLNQSSYKAYEFFTAAHEDTFFDSSSLFYTQ